MNDGNPKVWVALPAYNEEAGLGELLPRWVSVLTDLGLRHHFVIVDDGSTDGTSRVATEFSAYHPTTIVTHRPNQGLGPTLRDALNVACRQAAPDDVIVTMDADNTHPPELLGSMLDAMRMNQLDIVIASRYRPGAEVVGLGCARHLLSFGARLLFQAVFPIAGVRDYTCGYRLYRAGILRAAEARYGDAFCDQPGFTCTADILLKLARCGARCGEVGMILRYDRKGGASAMRVGTTVWRTLTLVLRHRLRRFSR